MKTTSFSSFVLDSRLAVLASECHSPVLWLIEPLSSPVIQHHCSRCKQTRPFASSEKFRINGHHKRLDVWLIYHCVSCRATWNLELHHRVLCTELSHDILVRYEQNDTHIARRVACDVNLLRKAGVLEIAAPEIAIRQIGEGWPDTGAGMVPMGLELSIPCSIRLDWVLARALDCSRGEVQRAVETGKLVFPEGGKKRLRRPAKHGQQWLLSLTGPA